MVRTIDSVHAADIVKANNADTLTLGSSWVGGAVPTSSDTVVIDSTLTTATTAIVTQSATNASLSGTLAIYGIKVTNPGGGITITSNTSRSPNLMTIGAGGIDMSNASQDLTFVASVGGGGPFFVFSGDQTWSIGNSRLFNLRVVQSLSINQKITLNGGGNVLFGTYSIGGSGTFDVTNATISLDGSSNISARSFSPNIILNSGGTVSQASGLLSQSITGAVTLNGGVISSYVGGPANAGTHNPTTGLSGTMTVNATGGQLGFTGTYNNFANTPTNSISGGITGSGTLRVANTAVGTGTTPTPVIAFSGNNSNFAGTFDFQGGSGSRLYRLSAAAAGSGSAAFNVASGNTVEVNAVSVSMGHLTGSGTLRNSTSGTTGNASVTVGALGRSGTFSGIIANGTSGNLAFTKTGTAAFALSGANTFTGLTTAGNGILRFNSVASTTGAQALGASSTVNLGVASTSTGEIDYYGATGTLDKNVFALGNGRNRIRNSGGGTLTLSGTLTKNGTILELAGGTFTVSGQITGTASNSDLFINGATVTLTNSNNDYNGPTYVYGNGSLVLGAGNVLPNGSALTLGGTGSDTGTGSITTGTFTDTIASLTTSSLGSTVGISVDGATAGGLTMGGLTFGAGTDTLVLSLMSPTLARYTLLSYTSRSGTFDSVSGAGNYNVVYGGSGTGTVDLQLKANQAATFTLTPAASRVLVGGSTTLSGGLVNTSTTGASSLTWSPTVTGSLVNLSSSAGASITAGGTSTITATFLAGPTAGSQAWSIVNSDPNAITTTSTASGSIDVVNQRSFSVSTGTIALGNFLRTATTSGSTTISSSGLNATTANAAIDTFIAQDTAGLNLALATGTNLFNGAEPLQQTTYALSGSATTTGAIAGGFTANVTAEFGTINPLTVSLTGTAYDPARASFTSGSTTVSWLVDVGSFNMNTGSHNALFDIHNLLTDLLYTADLRLQSVTALGTPSDSLSINLTPGAFGDLAAGDFSTWQATLFTSSAGSFTNTYQLNFVSAKDGASLGGSQNLTLIVTGFVGVPEPSTFMLAAAGLAGLAWARRRRR